MDILLWAVHTHDMVPVVLHGLAGTLMDGEYNDFTRSTLRGDQDDNYDVL